MHLPYIEISPNIRNCCMHEITKWADSKVTYVIQKSLGMDGEQSVDLFLVRTPPCTFLSFKAMAFPFPSSERPPASTQILSDQVELVIFICGPQMSSTSSSKSPKFTPISSASSSSG